MEKEKDLSTNIKYQVIIDNNVVVDGISYGYYKGQIIDNTDRNFETLLDQKRIEILNQGD